MFNKTHNKNTIDPEALATKAVIIERLRKIFPEERTEYLKKEVCPALKHLSKKPALNSDEAITINRTVNLIESIVKAVKK